MWGKKTVFSGRSGGTSGASRLILCMMEGVLDLQTIVLVLSEKKLRQALAERKTQKRFIPPSDYIYSEKVRKAPPLRF